MRSIFYFGIGFIFFFVFVFLLGTCIQGAQNFMDPGHNYPTPTTTALFVAFETCTVTGEQKGIEVAINNPTMIPQTDPDYREGKTGWKWLDNSLRLHIFYGNLEPIGKVCPVGVDKFRVITP
jgi:hypothetical protein